MRQHNVLNDGVGRGEKSRECECVSVECHVFLLSLNNPHIAGDRQWQK